MKYILALCLLALLPFAAFATEAVEGEVVVLTADNFDSWISSHDQTLVEFYAPWCGHCKALAPEYDAAAKQLKGKHFIAKVDCTEHRDLCSQHGVRGFPTLKLIRKDGTSSDYDEARKADAIVRYVIKQSQPAFVVLGSEAEVADFKKKGESDLVVLLTTPSVDSDEAKAFKQVASTLRNTYSFAITTGSPSSVVVYRSFDEPQVIFPGAVTADALTTFLKAEALPLIGEIGPENFQQYVERDLPLVWTFIDYESDAQNKIPEAIKPVAAAHRSQVIFCKLDGKRWGAHAKTFGLSGSTPGLVIEDRKSRKNFVFPEDKAITTEAIKAHVEAFLKGELIATVRSEEPPAVNDGPVKVVVGKTFDEIVMDPTKDVFIEFYAPWCGHCKSLAPKYEELGKMFAAEPTVVIAKIDGTENDTPVDVQGFPTLYFYPANNKASPIPYNGERSAEAMAGFVRQHASTLKDKPAAAADDSKDEL